jgi:trigger factor
VEVTVEKVGACVAKVSFTVPAEEFEGIVQRGLQEAGQRVRMKGFRAGKVPRAVLERTYGKRVRDQAIEHFLHQAYERAVGENDLKVVGYERVDLSGVALEPLAAGGPLRHAFELSLRPEVELADYKGMEVESELEPALDKEIEAALEDLRRQQSRPEPAGVDGLPADGMAVCTVDWLLAGEAVLHREGLRLSPASPLPGVDPEASKRALTGARQGADLELPMTFPADFEREAARGQAGICRIRVDQAFRMEPATDEQLKELLGVEAGQTLEAAVRARIDEAKRDHEERRVEQVLLERLLERHPMELPERMLADQVEIRLARLKRDLKEQGGLDEAQAVEQAQAQEAEVREQAERGMRALFLVQALAEKESLLVNAEDMQSELREIARRNNATLEEVQGYYREHGLFDQMAIEILERKVRRFLREAARITEPS